MTERLEDLSQRHGPITELFERPGGRQAWDRYRLSEAQLQFYREHGYVENVRLLSEEQCDLLWNPSFLVPASQPMCHLTGVLPAQARGAQARVRLLPPPSSGPRVLREQVGAPAPGGGPQYRSGWFLLGQRQAPAPRGARDSQGGEDRGPLFPAAIPA
jgi:hypothetical protein